MLPPIQQIVDEFEQAQASNDDRILAETAYALAVRAMDRGDFENAEHYAKASYAAAERLPSSSLDDVATTRISVGGVELPSYFHSGVIKARFSGLLRN